MCGRYTQLISWEQIQKLTGAKIPLESLTYRYNLAPSQKSAVVRLDKTGTRVASQLSWGLIPSWSKDKAIASSLINARAETLEIKPSFKAAFKSRRCIVPINGYYEWAIEVGSDKKQAYYIYSRHEEPIFLAGLWERWHSEGVQQIETFSIITTEAHSSLREIHQRMPALIKPEEFELWLNSATTQKDLKELLQPTSTEILKFHTVSDYVNSIANDSPRCIEKMS